MDDLVKRQDVFDVLDCMGIEVNETWYSFYQKAMRRLYELPSAQQ